MSNKYINEQLRKDSRALGANYIHLESMEDLENLQSDKRMFLFMEQKNLTPMVEDFTIIFCGSSKKNWLPFSYSLVTPI